MPTHKASTQINASPELVWEVVTNGRRMAEWLSPVRAVSEVSPPGPLQPGSKLEATIGNVGGAKINIKDARKGRRLYWSAGPQMAHMLGMPMHAEIELAGDEKQTQATITFKSNMMMGPLMRMMTGLDFGEEAPQTVSKLKQAVEGGAGE